MGQPILPQLNELTVSPLLEPRIPCIFKDPTRDRNMSGRPPGQCNNLRDAAVQRGGNPFRLPYRATEPPTGLCLKYLQCKQALLGHEQMLLTALPPNTAPFLSAMHHKVATSVPPSLVSVFPKPVPPKAPPPQRSGRGGASVLPAGAPLAAGGTVRHVGGHGHVWTRLQGKHRRSNIQAQRWEALAADVCLLVCFILKPQSYSTRWLSQI